MAQAGKCMPRKRRGTFRPKPGFRPNLYGGAPSDVPRGTRAISPPSLTSTRLHARLPTRQTANAGERIARGVTRTAHGVTGSITRFPVRPHPGTWMRSLAPLRLTAGRVVSRLRIGETNCFARLPNRTTRQRNLNHLVGDIPAMTVDRARRFHIPGMRQGAIRLPRFHVEHGPAAPKPEQEVETGNGLAAAILHNGREPPRVA